MVNMHGDVLHYSFTTTISNTDVSGRAHTGSHLQKHHPSSSNERKQQVISDCWSRLSWRCSPISSPWLFPTRYTYQWKIELCVRDRWDLRIRKQPKLAIQYTYTRKVDKHVWAKHCTLWRVDNLCRLARMLLTISNPTQVNRMTGLWSKSPNPDIRAEKK